MLLALLGAVTASATVAYTFGVPLAGAIVLADVATFGALVGAVVSAVVARLRRRPIAWRVLVGSAVASALAAAHLRFAPAGPAVIVVVVDCLRADRFSEAKMPRMYARSRDAVRYTQARAQSSWTRSAMPSLLSGRYPVEHGVYRTSPPDRIPSDVTLLSERFADAGWLTAAFAQQPQLDAAFGYDRGWGRYGWQDGRAHQLNPKWLRWNTIFRTVPRFVLVHYLDVHAPYTPSGKWRPRDLPPTTLKTRTYQDWRDTVEAIEEGTITPTPRDWAHLRGLYDGEVAELDARVDNALRKLQADGTLDAAWLVFTADHGERFGEHGRIAHMGPPDEAVLAVPLVIRPPGGTEARVVDEVVQHVDLVPTLLAAAGLPADPTLPGRDVLENVGAAPSFAEEWKGRTHYASVRQGDWKLVRGEQTALYELSADPGEKRDVAEAHPEVVAQMEGLLAAYFAAAAKGGIAAVDWKVAAASGAVWTSGERARSEVADVPAATMEALEALGYLEE